MDKVSLHSSSSLTYDPAKYPKDLDPFGDGVDEEEESKDKVAELPSQFYPDTLDPFADEDEQSSVLCSTTNTDDLNGSYDEKFSIKKDVSNSMSASFHSKASDYDESLDPFGDDCDDGQNNEAKSGEETRPNGGYHQETRTSQFAKPEDSRNNGTSKTNKQVDSKSAIKPPVAVQREHARNNNFASNYNCANQDSPVPVPPRRKHRNASPSTKSLNRASYSASSLERSSTTKTPDSPNSPNLNRLLTTDADSQLRHSISNLSSLSIRSTSPITTIRSSPLTRSRKKRRAPNPPGFKPSVNSDDSNANYQLNTSPNVSQTNLSDSNINHSIPSDAISVNSTNSDYGGSNPEIVSSNLEIVSSNPEIVSSNLEIEANNSEIETGNSEVEDSNLKVETSTPEVQTLDPEIEVHNSEIETRNPEIEVANSEVETRIPVIEVNNPEIQYNKQEIKNEE